MMRNNERKEGERRHEKKDDERIAERHEECRDAVVPKSSFLIGALVDLILGFRHEGIDAEKQQQERACYLKIEFVFRIVDKVDDK